MTSAIVTTNINALYPVAGQDNNSQGFRDNFSYIKTGLTTAASEITDLQTHAARTDTDNNFNGVKIENAETNLLHGTVLNGGSVPAVGNTSGIVAVDVRDAEYFTFTFTDDLTIRFSNWVASVGGLYSKITVDVKSDAGLLVTTGNFVIGATYTITTVGDTNFTLIGAASNTIGVTFVATGAGGGTTGAARKNRTVNFATTSGTVITPTGLTLPFAISTDTSTRNIFEAWSINGGNVVFVNYVGGFN